MPMKLPDSCLELLQAMVRFNTVNQVRKSVPFVEGELAAYLEDVARQWGLQTTRLPFGDECFNLLVAYEVDAVAPWLLFDSHLDTVGVEDMIVDPFAAEIRDGKIYGRGACDTKGTGAAMLWALAEAARGEHLHTNIAVLYSIDEEETRTGLRAFLDEHLPNLPHQFVGVIVGEPTSLRMITAHGGTVRWDIHTAGRAAHSSDPSQGRSAISDMLGVIDAIEDQYIPNLEATDPLIGRAQCSINLIAGGNAVNVIPASCRITVDRRIMPGEDPNTVVPAVESVLEEVRRSNPGIEVRQDEPEIHGALSADSNPWLAERVARVLSDLKLPTEPAGARYGTHASTSAEAGLEAVVIGPGDIAQAHKVDEYIECAQLQRGVELYAALMEQPQGFWSRQR